MTRNCKTTAQHEIMKTGSKPELDIKKIGIVSRDYRIKFKNGYRDFTQYLPDVLNLLDEKGCDTVLFSLFSIVPRNGYSPCPAINYIKNVRTILLEEFSDGKTREAGRYVVYYRTPYGWDKYEFCQVFGTITSMPQKKMDCFVKNEIPKRILGNGCILVCGETNGVKYSRGDKRIVDTFGLRKAIPKQVDVVLNPIHDRMTRFEMKLKRQFLSEYNRWVVSVWNKGKEDKSGKTRDGRSPAWTVFHNGNEVKVPMMKNTYKVEIGILDTNGS